MDLKPWMIKPNQEEVAVYVGCPVETVGEAAQKGKLFADAQVVELFPDATIHYDGYVDGETVKTVKALLKNNPRVVWLPLPSPLTTWVKVPVATESLCRMVKWHARLGLWILETKKQLACACILGTDIVETTGSLKP